MPALLQPKRQLVWNLKGQLVSARVQSLLTGEWNEMTLIDPDSAAVTQDQWNAYQSGVHIQNAMPQLNDEEREFLLSGATPDEWAKLFPPEED